MMMMLCQREGTASLCRGRWLRGYEVQGSGDKALSCLFWTSGSSACMATKAPSIWPHKLLSSNT